MKRSQYLAMAATLAALGMVPTISIHRAQAATPLDLEFQTYRTSQTGYRNLNRPAQYLLEHPNTEGHNMRYKLIYSE